MRRPNRLLALSAGIVPLVLTALLLAGMLRPQSSPAWPAAPPPPLPHPLDPLDQDEIKLSVAVLNGAGKVKKEDVYPLIALHEPPKEEVLAHVPGKKFRREAFVIVHDRKGDKTHEAVIDLKGRKLLSWKHVPGVQPSIMEAEFTLGAELVRKDKRWQTAMRKRGITDYKKVQIDVWAPGIMPGDPKGTRLVRAVSLIRDGAAVTENRPIEGVFALVDLTRNKVVEVIDRGVVPVPSDSGDFFDPRFARKRRTALKPLHIEQPHGPSFEIHGNEVRWDRWRFRFAMHPREGLVLYLVSCEDGGKDRPVLYRASLCEMVVPYAEVGPDWEWRNPFDEGEYGLGRWATSMRRGKEVPMNARLFDATFASDQGSPYRNPGLVAIYEQDGGILWTHSSTHIARTETRRARQLVVNALYTLGNYDYGMKWIFGQDGSLALEMELSGILLAKATAAKQCPVCEQKPGEDGRIIPEGPDRFGTLVAKQLLAPHHQHFMCFRLDMDVDGTKNSVIELNIKPMKPTATDRAPKGFFVEETRLRTENEAQRSTNADTHRRWKVFNPSRRNNVGHYRGYVLQPGATAKPLSHKQNMLRRRARFLDHTLSVTRQRRGEDYPAGTYPNQSRGGEGLPRWVNGELIENEDVVLWYTVGVTHTARPEEWPVMSVERAGFRLVPHGFFDRNPAVDLP